MAKLRFSGPLSLRLRSFWTLNRIAISTMVRHALGIRIAPDWDASFEIGIRFWRHQFTVAMTEPDMDRGRLIFDSVQTETDDVYDVRTEHCDAPKGDWYYPAERRTDATILHFHGGGYTFHGGVSRRFAAMLAHHIGAAVFAPDYRLTPEHAHPAQVEDALTAWHYVNSLADSKKVVVSGESAGGHMALMLLQTLKVEGLAQPALCLGLSPWTDIGDRGDSLKDNNRFDLVQGWMAMKFGELLDPDGIHGRAALSPIYQDFTDLAPLYIQVGGREVLRDMIVEFAEAQAALGTDVTIDIWPDMPHVFQAYDTLKGSSTAALHKLTNRVHSICFHR